MLLQYNSDMGYVDIVLLFPVSILGKRALGQARHWDFRRHCSGSAAADFESTTPPVFRDTRLSHKDQW